jgi:ABC-type amino acid transport substrate-binding protein
VFVGAIASVLTVSQLEDRIDYPEDLRRLRVATVAGTTSAGFLERELVPYREASTLDEALAALAEGRVDAVVYDRPLLLHKGRGRLAEKVRVLPVVFERQEYALVLRPGYPHREAINRALLAVRGTRWWEEQRFLRLGE